MKMAAGRRGIEQNFSEMEVTTFVRTQRVIWDHLLSFKGNIVQKQLSFNFVSVPNAVNNYRVVMLSVLFFLPFSFLAHRGHFFV